MAFDKKLFDEWHKQFPDATESEVQHVKDMYGGEEAPKKPENK